MKAKVMEITDKIKVINIMKYKDPIIEKIKMIDIKKVLQYIAYFLIFSICINSIKNTKEYIIDNKKKDTGKIAVHASISLVLLWTAIYFLVR